MNAAKANSIRMEFEDNGVLVKSCDVGDIRDIKPPIIAPVWPGGFVNGFHNFLDNAIPNPRMEIHRLASHSGESGVV